MSSGDTRATTPICGRRAASSSVAQRRELRTGERVAGDAELASDRGRGDGVVASDHADLDARPFAVGDGGLGLGARWVDDADHGQEREILYELDEVPVGIERAGVEVTSTDHHHPFTLRGDPVVLVQGQMAIVVGDRMDPAVGEHVEAAAGDEHVGGALDEAAHDGAAVRVGHLVERGHELVVRVERHLGHAWVASTHAVQVEASFGSQHDERTLCGVADQLAVLVEPGIGAERHGHQHGLEVDRCTPVAEELPDGAVPLARDLVAALPGDAELACGHLVQGQRPGLVRADRRDRSEGLDRRESFHDRAPVREYPCAHGVQGGDNGREADRDGSDGQCNAGDEDLVERIVVADADAEHDQKGHAGDASDDDGQLVELLLERCLVGFGLVEQLGDMADLGVHAGGGDDHLTAPASDGGVHECEAVAIPETDVAPRDGGNVLQRGGALTGQRCLFDLEGGCEEEPAVGWNPVARLHQDDVAGHQFLGVDLDGFSVAADAGDVLEHLLERADARRGL